ncbi:MAG: M15 family metallopeptidase [Kurthia sp.]|nr:M15 family metallopeptidase [Candidatus Kurthia equi]
MNKKSLYHFPVVMMLSASLLLVACGNEEQKNTKNEEKVEEQNITKKAEEKVATETKEKEKEKVKEEKRDAGGYFINQKPVQKEHYEKGILIANKVYPMPKSFAPGESKEARAAFNKMNTQAKKAGFELDAFSTYRSYERQVELYNNYVARDGQEAADTYSARPGFSEHQTGLAFDIGEVGNSADYADDRFGETEAGKWIAAHAHEFGFIMRYPQGKEKITGYKYESWHFRYVGKDIATKIYKDNSTLEEYLGVNG